MRDFAVVRIEGHPAAHFSFWIKQAEFLRDYETVAGFWLPYRDETAVEVRLHGEKVLTIDHSDYAVKRKPRWKASKTTAISVVACRRVQPCLLGICNNEWKLPI